MIIMNDLISLVKSPILLADPYKPTYIIRLLYRKYVEFSKVIVLSFCQK